ncbi:MAG: ABC transporter permease, partial [Bacillota bacterium]
HLVGLEGDAFAGEDGLVRGLQVVEGRLPAGAEEILLPAGPALSAGLGVGDAFEVEWADSEGAIRRITYRVCGLLQTDDPFLGAPLTRLPEADVPPPVVGAGESGGNFILLSSEAPGRAAEKVDGFLPGARVISRLHGAEMAGSLLSGVFSSGRVLTILIMLFCSLGVLNVLLLAFLERQRELGIFKALGSLNDEVRMMLLQEGFLTALLGMAAGTAGTLIAVTLLNRYTPVRYVVRPGAFVLAAAAAAVVFYLGAALPSGMARNMTVQDLLHRRRIL